MNNIVYVSRDLIVLRFKLKMRKLERTVTAKVEACRTVICRPNVWKECNGKAAKITLI